MILSPTNKFIFFKPMKTAGSSIEFALALSCGPDDIVVGGIEGEEQDAGFMSQNNNIIKNNRIIEVLFHTHATPDAVKKRFKPNDWKEIETYNWITMTRNPWDALVSYYWWSISENAEGNKHLTITRKDSKAEAVRKFKRLVFGPVKPMKGVEPYSIDNCSCFEYIKKYNIACADKRINYYIRFENLNEDFESVVNELGLYNVELPRFKTTQKKLKKHYSFYYDEEAKQLVADGFKDYIKRFEYKFEKKNIRLSRRERAKTRKNK